MRLTGSIIPFCSAITLCWKSLNWRLDVEYMSFFPSNSDQANISNVHLRRSSKIFRLLLKNIILERVTNLFCMCVRVCVKKHVYAPVTTVIVG